MGRADGGGSAVWRVHVFCSDEEWAALTREFSEDLCSAEHVEDGSFVLMFSGGRVDRLALLFEAWKRIREDTSWQ